MDDDFFDDEHDEQQFANISMERLGCSRYAVSASIMVGSKVEKRRIECANPAWGTAQLEEELSELLLVHERTKAKRRKAKE
jgi:hypothetical protein